MKVMKMMNHLVSKYTIINCIFLFAINMREIIRQSNDHKKVRNTQLPFSICMGCFKKTLSEDLYSVYCSSSCKDDFIMSVCHECYKRKHGDDSNWILKLELRMDNADISSRKILLSHILYYEKTAWYNIVDVTYSGGDKKDAVRFIVCDDCFYEFIMNNIDELSTEGESSVADSPKNCPT
jgi:hypothetical protein